MIVADFSHTAISVNMGGKVDSSPRYLIIVSTRHRAINKTLSLIVQITITRQVVFYMYDNSAL